MKYLGSISDAKDLVNKEYVDSHSGVTGVKGSSESSYRTGNVNLTAANVGAISTNTNGNTQNLYRPIHLNGLNDNTLDSKINTLRANRLAFLPADQIIIEKTTDGGTTWVDAGIADSTKVGLFSETRAGVTIPLLNGVKSLQCGLRITFTAMKYNVPAGTAETAKYNYWNSNYILSTERYNQLKEMYFWVSTNSDTVSVKLERATGAASTTWITVFNESTWGMTGWSGNDYIKFSQGVFGGGTNQTTNYWNYRLTFMTRGVNGGTTMATTYTTSAQSIMEIRGYGDTWWTAGNEYAANDKIYTHDYQKNVTFPAQITATRFNGGVKDAGSDNTITFQYSGSGITSTSWLAGWNGYKLMAITPQNAVNLQSNNSSGKDANDIGVNAITYYTSNGPATSLGATTNDGALYVQRYNDKWEAQIAQDYRNGALFVRGKNNGTWQSWQKVYDTAHKPSASDVGAVPTSRKVNGKALSADITLSASDVGAATSGHTHATTIATSTGTNQITLSHGAKYSITAGGTSYVFTMPSAPSVPSITLNGSSTTSPSFYAPTSAGTSGYYLKSNGSGAPTWAAFPSIPTIPSNNVTGSGTSGQLAQWNGAHTITSGPKVTVSTSGPSGGSNGDIWFVHS